MGIACWTSKAKTTHSEYVIAVFPMQQWLQERVVMLQCYVTRTYIVCVCCLLHTVMLHVHTLCVCVVYCTQVP